MKALNAKIEDFHYNKDESSEDEPDHHDDNIYDLGKPTFKARIEEEKVDTLPDIQDVKKNTMKNNFMEMREEKPQDIEEEDEKVSEDFWKEEEEETGVHPLKAGFMNSFNDLEKSKSKVQANTSLTFIKFILIDSSVKDQSQGFYLLDSEFSRVTEILAKILKIHEVDPLVIFETFDNLKNIQIYEGANIHESIHIKVKTLLTVFTKHMIDVTEIGHTNILNDFYTILNSYTMELKKAEVSKLLREVDYSNGIFNKVPFETHFYWFTSQILGKFFFLKDIEP